MAPFELSFLVSGIPDIIDTCSQHLGLFRANTHSALHFAEFLYLPDALYEVRLEFFACIPPVQIFCFLR